MNLYGEFFRQKAVSKAYHSAQPHSKSQTSLRLEAKFFAKAQNDNKAPPVMLSPSKHNQLKQFGL